MLGTASPASPGQRQAAGSRTDAEGVRRKQVGWEYVHIAIDDATRLTYVEVLSDEKAITAVGFLRRRQALHRLRHHRRAADHRQRISLPASDPRDRLLHAPHPPPTHPPIPTADQGRDVILHLLGLMTWILDS